jgi:hypothetical protein
VFLSVHQTPDKLFSSPAVDATPTLVFSTLSCWTLFAHFLVLTSQPAQPTTCHITSTCATSTPVALWISGLFLRTLNSFASILS